ncbi:MAG: CHASE2 domain-containing protein, partial [Rhizobiaceae bacterium]
MLGRQRLIAAILLLCIAATAALLHQSRPVIVVQNLLTEWRSVLAKRPVTGEVAFLAIDKASIDHIGQWPWPRRVHAEIIDRLVDAGAAEIAFDIDFSTSSNHDDDRLLTEALKRANGSVILAAFRQSASIDADNLTMETNQPISSLLDHAWPASVNVLADTDGKVRTVPISQMSDGDLLPSLPALLAGTTGSEDGTFAVDFSIDATQVPAHSVKGLLTGRLAPDALHGKKVIVGATALELHDTLAVPVYGLLPGPVLQVLATETLLQDRSLQPTSATAGLVLLCFFLLLAVVVSWWLRLWFRCAVLVGSALGLEIAAWYLQMQNAIVVESATVHLATAGFLLSTLTVELYFRRIRIELSKQKNSDLLSVFSQVTRDNFDAIVVCDDNGLVRFESNIAREVLGLTENSSLTGTEFSSALPSPLVPVFEEMMARLRRGAVPAPVSGEMQFERTDGTEAILDYILTPSLLPAGKYDQWIRRKAGGAVCFTARDVTSEREQRARIEYLAEYDSLTGALNRHSFVKRCNHEEGDAESCMFVVELLGMEVVNGTFGLEMGEKVLVEAVQRLRMCGGWAIEVARIETHRLAFRVQSV